MVANVENVVMLTIFPSHEPMNMEVLTARALLLANTDKDR